MNWHKGYGARAKYNFGGKWHNHALAAYAA